MTLDVLADPDRARGAVGRIADELGTAPRGAAHLGASSLTPDILVHVVAVSSGV